MAKIDNQALVEELKARGLVYQQTAEKLEDIFSDSVKRTAYLGVDPTAKSIHVGNLVTYMLAEHLMRAGHKMVLLVGGATGLIGDPSGKSSERDFADASTVKERTEAVRSQLQGIKGLSKMKILNNHDWFKKMGVLEFLREVGKHFTINSLIARESVARRLESENGISYTEFSYGLLQGYDFYHLHGAESVDLELGGADQWGNIVAGVDLVRKKTGDQVFGITIPLVTDKNGKKFGKSEGNPIWLDPEMTSYYAFYQFWLNVSDEEAIELIKKFTFIPLSEIKELARAAKNDASGRMVQKRLAYEVTAFVHGKEIADDVQAVSEHIFSNQPIWELGDEDVKRIKQYAPVVQLKDRQSLVDILIENELASSKREAREFISNSAIRVNGVVVDETSYELNAKSLGKKLSMIQRGKKHKLIVTIG